MAADSKARLLREAERFVIQGKIQQAIVEYLKIIQSDPGDILILNTVGDLFLRLGKVAEANKCFSQVAENYVRENFLSKAVAVYKKILAADSGNLEVNLTLASLYSNLGATVDARNQYLRVAALFEKEGKAKESMGAYEKVAELDPANAAVQRKLAELHQAGNEVEKAHFYWTGAARAQSKAGDLSGAVDSFRKAMQLDPLNVEAMRGFLDCCLRMERVSPALDQLEKSLAMAPGNLDMREMLGQASLADKRLDAAALAFDTVFSQDSSRYENYFALSQAFMDSGAYDRAAKCLDSMVPILITRRETERAVGMYESILQRCPSHVTSLIDLASIFSATGESARHLDALDKIADYFLESKNPIEALEHLEKYLQLNPDSEKHRDLHRQAFAEAYADIPYVEPAFRPEPSSEIAPGPGPEDAAGAGKSVQQELVEVDLLLNYGLRERALSVLQNLETREPFEKEVRVRLLSLYKDEKKNVEAAEQCLLLAALYRGEKDEESAKNYLSEARQLSPEVAAYEHELDNFARRKGIVPDKQEVSAADEVETRTDGDAGPSGDLLDIFLEGDQAEEASVDPAPQANPERVADNGAQATSADSLQWIQEQLKEADFYIRLGFREEALGKLDEIARIKPDCDELEERYQKLGESPRAGEREAAEAQGLKEEQDTVPREHGIQDVPGKNEGIGSAPSQASQQAEVVLSDDPYHIRKRPVLKEPQESGFEITPGAYSSREPAPIFYPEPPPSEPRYASGSARTHFFPEPPPPEPRYSSGSGRTHFYPESARSDPAYSPESGRSDFRVNEIFADLIDEVSSLSDQEIAKEDFEEHFSLGIAYREMDLIEEAITEFQNALKALDLKKDARRVVQCCGMLSTCFLKKGMPRSAVRWCQTGLSVSDISSHESMALRYDMGVAHSMAGSSEQALECFDNIFEMDPGYRDVAQRIDELRASQ